MSFPQHSFKCERDFSKQEDDWCLASIDTKAYLFEVNSACQGLYIGLSSRTRKERKELCQVLYKLSEPSLRMALKLVSDRIQTLILSEIDPRDSPRFLRMIQSMSGTTKSISILARAKDEAREAVVKHVKKSIQILEEITSYQVKLPLQVGERFVATKGFLSKIPESARRCATCARVYQEWEHLRFHKCLLYSTHTGCVGPCRCQVADEKELKSGFLKKIFKKRDPLLADAAIAGKDLIDVYHGYDHDSVYLALNTLDWDGDLYESFPNRNQRIQWLRNCLQDHEFDEKKCEATMKDSNIVLNIWEWVRADDATAVTNVGDVIAEKEHGSFYTYMVYPEDSGGIQKCHVQAKYTTCDILLLPCDNYLRGGKPVTWCFFEWTGRRSVDGG